MSEERAAYCETCAEVTPHGVEGPVTSVVLLAIFGTLGLTLAAFASPVPWLVPVPWLAAGLLVWRALRFTDIDCARCRGRAERAHGPMLFRRSTEIGPF